MEILPGIHKIDAVRGANSYLMLNSDSVVMIDTGAPGSGSKIIDYIKKLGRNPQELKYIILTHADTDHTGNALKIQKVSGAQVAAHANELSNLRGGFTFSRSKGLLSLVSSMRFLRFRPIIPDILLQEGDVIAGLQVIYTPGHTRGSICLYRPPDVLFVGDTVRVNNQNNPRFSAKAFTWDTTQAYQSVQKISELSFQVLLPGHGEPIMAKCTEKLKALLQVSAATSLDHLPR